MGILWLGLLYREALHSVVPQDEHIAAHTTFFIERTQLSKYYTAR